MCREKSSADSMSAARLHAPCLTAASCAHWQHSTDLVSMLSICARWMQRRISQERKAAHRERPPIQSLKPHSGAAERVHQRQPCAIYKVIAFSAELRVLFLLNDKHNVCRRVSRPLIACDSVRPPLNNIQGRCQALYQQLLVYADLHPPETLTVHAVRPSQSSLGAEDRKAAGLQRSACCSMPAECSTRRAC